MIVVLVVMHVVLCLPSQLITQKYARSVLHKLR